MAAATIPYDPLPPGPAYRAYAVTKSDSTTYEGIVGIWVGGTGNIQVTPAGQNDDSKVVIESIPAGVFIPLAVSKIWSTNTTATKMIAFGV